MRIKGAIVVVMATCLLAGCSSGTGSQSSSSSGSGTGSSPDMGTLATMDDSSQYTLTNAATGMQLGIAGASQTAGANAAQENPGGSADADWHFIPMNNGQYNVENLLTHQVLAIQNASSTSGAQVVQWADDGTPDHLWEVYQLADGNYLVKNVNSGQYLESADAGSTSVAGVDQGSRSAGSSCTCQEWKVTSTGQPAYPNPIQVNVGYTAPDTQTIGIHDPSMVKAGTTYYLFSTHGLIHAHQSTDRINFQDDGYALPSLPAWTGSYTGGSGDLWAPDASVHNGGYWLYYAASTFGSANSAIGLAISSTGQPGSYVDSGAPVYTSSNCPGANAIDPSSIVDSTGNAWLAFGSWSNGIQIVPVDATTGLPTGAACTQIAYHPSGTGIEGAFIYPHGGSYYLFASIDTCCQGDSSTYRIIVGRSSSVTGPYTDRGGVALNMGGGTILLSAHGSINGPGGQTVLLDTDGDILVYHYYDGNSSGAPTLGLNVLGWTQDGWPYVQ